MVARRKAAKKPQMTDYEAVKLALSKVETISDEEMAAFWGPDWKEREAKISEEIAAGRVHRAYSEEEFLAALEQQSKKSADV